MEFLPGPAGGRVSTGQFLVADDAKLFAVFAIAARVARCYRSEPYLDFEATLSQGSRSVKCAILDPAAEDSGHHSEAGCNRHMRRAEA